MYFTNGGYDYLQLEIETNTCDDLKGQNGNKAHQVVQRVRGYSPPHTEQTHGPAELQDSQQRLKLSTLIMSRKRRNCHGQRYLGFLET